MINRTLKHVVLALIVFIWVVPFVALVTTSLRSETASKTSGFWTAFTPTELGHRFSTHDGDAGEFTVLEGNIFERLNQDGDGFDVSGEISSVFFRGRVPDPNNPGETMLLRRLVPVGEVMDVRGGDFVFDAQGNFTLTFNEPTEPRPKNLDVFVNQDPVFGTDAYVEVMFENSNVPNALISSFIVTIPATIILLESARIDGANHLQIFVKLIIPLSVPALASFSIFQFLWVWNDLIVALYIGSADSSDLVFPIRLQKQLGTFKDQLHLLNASAVISMIVPVVVFLSMQRYFIRGLLAGSVKGG